MVNFSWHIPGSHLLKGAVEGIPKLYFILSVETTLGNHNLRRMLVEND